MLFLHPNLAKLSKLCATESSRYSMCGVNVTATPTGYRAVATDGRRLGIVESNDVPEVRISVDDHGKETNGPMTVAHLPLLAAAPNGETTATIPTPDFLAVLKSTGKAKKYGPAAYIACIMGKDVSTLASTDPATLNATTVRNLDGRFPDAMGELKRTERTEPVATVRISAKVLTDVLDAAAAFATDDGYATVTLELREKGTPIVIRSATTTQAFTGLAMGFDDKAKQPIQHELNNATERIRHAHDLLRELHNEQLDKLPMSAETIRTRLAFIADALIPPAPTETL